MTEQTDIGEILEQRPPEPAQDVGAPADDGIARDDKGRFAPREPKAEVAAEPMGEVAAPPAAPSSPPEGYVPLAALIDHRLEARQAKQERDEARRQLAELQRPKQEQVPFWDNPEGNIDSRFQTYEQKSEARAKAAEFRASRAEVIAEHGKAVFNELEQALQAAADAGDPSIGQLQQAMQNSDHPVGVALQWFEDRPERVRSRLEKEVEPQIVERLKAQGWQPPSEQPPAGRPAPVMPSNLAGARNVGTRSGPQWEGRTSLESIFKQR
jgi:hypothetical protein